MYLPGFQRISDATIYTMENSKGEFFPIRLFQKEKQFASKLEIQRRQLSQTQRHHKRLRAKVCWHEYLNYKQGDGKQEVVNSKVENPHTREGKWHPTG